MKIKTSELIDGPLDWAAAKAANQPLRLFRGVYCVADGGDHGALPRKWKPSTDWSQGGPIIDREDIDLWKDAPGDFAASIGVVVRGIHGPTKLIAAMRCFVASKLGDEVDVPEELCQ